MKTNAKRTEKYNSKKMKIDKISMLTSGDAKPFVPRGWSPASVNSSLSLFAESKSASLALVYSSVNNTFLADKKREQNQISI